MLRVPAQSTATDVTVHSAHLVPADPDFDPSYGVEPGGGVRTITEGVRIINMARGAALSARDRLPQAPNDVLAVPPRMGGGFFYLIGTILWRSDTWLSKPVPVFQAPQAIKMMWAGLDRVYLRTQGGANIALDPATGKPADLGALPGTPFLGTYTAVDGWHAVAIADLRGVVSTDDAGVTWRSVKLPIEPHELKRVGDAIFVGSAGGVKAQWFEVQRGGFVTRAAAPAAEDDGHDDVPDAIQRVYGKRPLQAAVEDGWPLGDGSAVVARDGELARIRLSDGVVLEHAAGAFPQKPSKCHPVPLGTGVFGFVCGEPHGETAIYAFNQGKLDLLRSFEQPRRVLASGNGSLVVHGGCDADAPTDDARSPEHVMCVRSKAGDWRDVRIKDPSCVRQVPGDCEEYARDQRVVALSSGALVVLSPPQAGRLEGVARLTVLEPNGTVRTVPLVLDATADTTPSVLRVLRLGMWLDGFEEREPNVIGGWAELAGILVGVKIKIDGHTKHGLLLHDGGTMLASGKWALGFSGGRRGYETMDGGMTWAPIDLPDAIAQGRAAVSRSCGPVGCVANGWIRVGWGAPPPEEAQVMPALPTITPVSLRPSSSTLSCDLVKVGPPAAANAAVVTNGYDESYRYGRYGGGYGGYYPGYQRPKQTFNCTGFFTMGAPKLTDKDVCYGAQAKDSSNLVGAAAQWYAIGPKEGEWDQHNRWTVRWLSPFGSGADVKSTPMSTTPRAVMESTGYLTMAQPRYINWTVHAGDDPGHALLIGRQTQSASEFFLMELEDGRPPSEIRRSDGEPFTEIESAVRSGGRWFVATQQNPGTSAASVVWEIDSGVAREVIRLPRTTDGNGRVASRLARRADGRAVGVVVDGQPSAARTGTAMRWVAPVDVETGAVSDPEPLGPIDLADRAVPTCRGDEPGWIFDVTWSPGVRVETAAASSALRSVLARLRVSRDRACFERLSGLGEIEPLKVGGKANENGIEVSVLSGQTRHLLRCTSK
jgi:hypothetical protein